ncbi:diguanylate cyclase [Sphingomonas sp. H39-1-10]|uniref:diguanylate cyclase n=1 Tax=Sphingomonas pollutisoli TaxID=3030829 RepID=UPI0023B93E8D|nr:diguanylate cyclase [Sphingomonas pollutisoli]MDF0488233.1 diguanylate cyclase [Sphingomonas pollutisoli]
MDSPFAFLLPAYMAIFTIVFGLVWRWYRRGAAWWAFGFLWGAVGFAMPLFPQSVQDAPLGALGADGCFALSFLGYGQGLLHHIGRPHRHRLARLGIAAATMALCGYAIYGPRNQPLEYVASDISCGLLLLPVLIAMRRRVTLKIDRLLFAITALVALETTGRGVFVTLVLLAGHPAYLRTIYGFEMQSVAAILGMVWGLAALAAILLDVVAGYARDAITDPLSGLLNRRGFEQALAALPLEGCMIIGDIDHFKSVNDRFGHLAGDGVIAGLAAIIAAALPPGGVAARTGGEEFAIFLPGAGAGEGARLAGVIGQRFAAADRGAIDVAAPLTASFGVAASEAADRFFLDVTARADAALYAAKDAGRNRTVTHEPQIGARFVPEVGFPMLLRAAAAG